MARRSAKRFKNKNIDLNKYYLTEEEAFDWVEKEGYLPLQNIPYQLFSNIEFLTKLSKTNHLEFLRFVPDSLLTNKNNLGFVKNLKSRKFFYQSFKYLPVEFRKNKSFVMGLLEEQNEGGDRIYESCHLDLRNDKEVIKKAIRYGLSPYKLAKRFRSDKSILLAFAKANNSVEDLKMLNLRNIKMTDNLANRLMKLNPKYYELLDSKRKRRKAFASLYIKNDISGYGNLPKALQLNNEIMAYVLSREPDNCRCLEVEDILKKDFSKLSLSNLVRTYIHEYCEEELYAKNADVFKIASAKKVIFKPSLDEGKKSLCIPMHFDKKVAFQEIDKILEENKENTSKCLCTFYGHLSYELKEDLDFHLKMLGKWPKRYYYRYISSKRPWFIDDSKVRKAFHKKLFVKGKFKEIDSNHLNHMTYNKNVREYMIKKILMHDTYRQNDIWFAPSAEYHEVLTSKEMQNLVSDSYEHLPILDSYFRNQVLWKNLQIDEITKLLKSSRNLRKRIGYLITKGLLRKGDFSRDVEFAKYIFDDWPNKMTLKYLDMKYLVQNPSFNAFLANTESITVHAGDLKEMPAIIKQNKNFVMKVLNYEIKLYAELPSVMKTNKEITDWIFTVAPRFSKYLSPSDFKKIDTTNLHPVCRKIIHRQYLSKCDDSIFEKALMKKKLLCMEDFKKAS